MIRRLTLCWWRIRPGAQAQEARNELEKSKDEQAAARGLTREVSALHQENRITARMHEAFRGGPQA